MSKVLVVYASLTGNTEEMANLVEKGLQTEGVTVDKIDVIDVDLGTLEEYENIMLGAYTWGEGALPDEFVGRRLQFSYPDKVSLSLLR